MADTASVKIGNRRLSISNPDKVFYNAGQFTKLDVVNYYLQVAPFLLPHFRDRPVTLKRYPNGIHGEVFYEKDAPSFTPEWVKTFPVPRHEGGPDINYILVNDRATLLWAANMAALELHPFLHRVPEIDRPTHVVFDLDPGEGTNILRCAEVALRLHDVLKKLRLKSFPKVSGSKGLQVYVPLNVPNVSYEVTQPFAKAVAEATDNNAAPDPDEVAAADMLTEAKSGARLSLAKRSGTKKVAVVSGKAPKAPSDRAKSHSKQDRIVALLQRPKGATLEALANETQWQKHSVRGFLAGTVRKKLKLSLPSEKIEGIRTYRIGTGKAAKSKKTSAARRA